MKKIGFTGTQKGLTAEQSKALEVVLFDLIRKHHEIEFHHGDCVGADSQAHMLFSDLAVDLQFPASIVLHPPENESKRAWAHFLQPKVPCYIRAELPYLVRNEQIVLQTEMLIACPRERKEQLRSGTWATVRRATTAGREIIYVFPSGEVVRNHAS